MEEVKQSKTEETKEKPKEIVKKEEKKMEKPRGPSIFSRIKDILVKYRRVLDVAQKPDQAELISSLKITLIGIGIIGFIGFVIFMIYYLVVL